MSSTTTANHGGGGHLSLAHARSQSAPFIMQTTHRQDAAASGVVSIPVMPAGRRFAGPYPFAMPPVARSKALRDHDAWAAAAARDNLASRGSSDQGTDVPPPSRGTVTAQVDMDSDTNNSGAPETRSGSDRDEPPATPAPRAEVVIVKDDLPGDSHGQPRKQKPRHAAGRGRSVKRGSPKARRKKRTVRTPKPRDGAMLRHLHQLQAQREASSGSDRSSSRSPSRGRSPLRAGSPPARKPAFAFGSRGRVNPPYPRPGSSVASRGGGSPNTAEPTKDDEPSEASTGLSSDDATNTTGRRTVSRKVAMRRMMKARILRKNKLKEKRDKRERQQAYVRAICQR